jgi:predicted RNA binding protein YcfA (HicA-like mRNA interferase family)
MRYNSIAKKEGVLMSLTARKAIQMILKKGGHKVRAGAEHDIYNVNGTLIPVPRHRGDLSPGVEQEIRKALKD